MALIVEDGSIVANANSYISVSDTDTYFSDLGDTTWSSATTADKEAALISATQYIDLKYGHNFQGERSTTTQELLWPRAGVDYYDDTLEDDEMPRNLKRATAEAALLFLSSDLFTTDSQSSNYIKRLQAGSVSIEYFDDYLSKSNTSKVDFLIKPLLGKAFGTTVNLIRIQ